MKTLTGTALALAIAAGTFGAGPASASPASSLRALATEKPSQIVEVHHRPWHRRHRDDFAVGAAAGILGFTMGAIAGSAMAQPQPVAPAYGVHPADWHAYCASRYRSYDPYSGTFVGYDGRRRPCR